MDMLRRLVLKAANTIGYDIRRVPSKAGDVAVYYRVYGKAAVENRRFYNIGAGGFRHRAWTNVDHRSDWYKGAQGHSIGIDHDLLSLQPIPVEDDTAELVYSSHTIEHITKEAAQNMFNESHRILKNGGFFRVTTPNIDLDFRAYKEGDKYFYYWIHQYRTPKAYKRAGLNRPLDEASIQQIFLYQFASSTCTLHIDGSPKRIDDEELDRVFREMKYEEALDYCVSKCSLEVQKKYPGNHISWWNKDKLLRMLSLAGFGDIYLSGYGQSRCPVLRNISIFDNTHPQISVYVEAIK
jgi:predicted SAM-dependent methyltransferase